MMNSNLFCTGLLSYPEGTHTAVIGYMKTRRHIPSKSVNKCKLLPISRKRAVLTMKNFEITFSFIISLKMTWTIDQLLHSTLPSETCEYILADVKMTQFTLLAILLLSLSYPLLHKVFLRFEKYNAIESSRNQLVLRLRSSATTC